MQGAIYCLVHVTLMCTCTAHVIIFYVPVQCMVQDVWMPLVIYRYPCGYNVVIRILFYSFLQLAFTFLKTYMEFGYKCDSLQGCSSPRSEISSQGRGPVKMCTGVIISLPQLCPHARNMRFWCQTHLKFILEKCVDVVQLHMYMKIHVYSTPESEEGNPDPIQTGMYTSIQSQNEQDGWVPSLENRGGGLKGYMYIYMYMYVHVHVHLVVNSM